jgi:hypothetical protein
VQGIGDFDLRDTASNGTGDKVVQDQAHDQTTQGWSEDAPVNPGKMWSGDRPVNKKTLGLPDGKMERNRNQSAEGSAQDRECQEALALGRDKAAKKYVEALLDRHRRWLFRQNHSLLAGNPLLFKYRRWLRDLL